MGAKISKLNIEDLTFKDLKPYFLIYVNNYELPIYKLKHIGKLVGIPIITTKYSKKDWKLKGSNDQYIIKTTKTIKVISKIKNIMESNNFISKFTIKSVIEKKVSSLKFTKNVKLK
jgi:hypothetical protein